MKLDLSHFTGTEQWHRYSSLFRNVLLTDGALYLAEQAKAFWLMDLIASWQKQLKQEPFQVWDLTVDRSCGVVVATDGNKKQIARQEIPYTDFPLQHIRLYASREENGDVIILLPTEY